MVYAGGSGLPPALLKRFGVVVFATYIWHMITEKEQEVFELMATGMPKDEIRRNAGVSKRTVERCFESLRDRYGAKNNFSLYSVAANWLMAGELMATLESLVNYCVDDGVRREAKKRLIELETKYKNG